MWDGDESMKSSFSRMLLSHIIVLLIPLIVMGLLSYWWVSDIVAEQVQKSYEVMIREVKNSVDNRFKELDALCLQLSHAPWVRKLMYMQSSSIDYRRMDSMELTDHVMELRGYDALNDFIDTVALVFPEKGMVISSAGMADTNIFFNELYRLEGMDYGKWQEIISVYSGPKVLHLNTLYLNRLPAEVLTYTQTLPSEDRKSHVALVTFIKKEVLTAMLIGLQIDKGSSIYVLDNKGHEIVNINGRNDTLLRLLDDSYGEGKNFSGSIKSFGKRYFVFREISPVNKWEYIVTIPYKTVMAKVDYVRTVTIVLAVFLSLLGLGISYTLAVHNYNPLSELVHLMRKRFSHRSIPGVNEYDFLQTALCSLLNEEDYLKEQVEKRKPLIRDAYMLKLLTDNMGAGKLPLETLESIDVVFPYSSFTVVLFIFKSSKYVDEDARFRISDSMAGYNAKVYYVEIDRNRKAAVINIDKGENINNLVVKLKESLEKEIQVKCIVGVGKTCFSIQDISNSYKEASIAADYRLIRNNSEIIFFDDVKNATAVCYYYPINKEEQLLNVLRMADCEEAINIVNEIISRNINDNHLCINSARCLFYDLMGTALKALSDLGLTGSLEIDQNLISNLDTLAEMENYLKILYKNLCDVIERKKKSHNEILKESIKCYIDENYDRQDLSLEYIAQVMNISPSYLSKFFKDQFGYNFLDYLNRRRVKKAKELLNGQMTVMEVAQMVGYNNDVTFRRVFKKYEGVTPAELYR